MSSILLDFHNKLGDNLNVNAIVRDFARRYDRVGIFCIPPYKDSVSFMYRDLDNIELIYVNDHRRKQVTLLKNRLFLTRPHFSKVLTVQDDSELGVITERQLYALAGVPHEQKWSGFYVERDSVQEDEFYKKHIKSEPYVFIHDDKIYERPINTSGIDPTYFHFKPDLAQTKNTFDYCKVIENAKEIHVVDSAFMFLVDLLPYHNPTQKLYVHRYARENPPWRLPVLKKHWTILTQP